MSALAILTECPLANCPLANCRLTKCPLANCLDTIMNSADNAYILCVQLIGLLTCSLLGNLFSADITNH